MKPSQRSVGLGYDHLETVGGRHRYVKHMTTHLERMSRVGPVISLEPPKAAFGNGKYRTPQAVGQAGKSEKIKNEEFKEVSEAFRRVLEVHGGARKSSLETRAPDWQVQLAANISRNRRLGSKQTQHDAAHAAELYHQRRRIANSYSATERKKNKLDPDVFPVYQMRKARFNSAAELLAAETRRAASGLHASHSAAAAGRRPQSAGSQSARPAYASAATAMAGGSGAAPADSRASSRTAGATARPHSARAATSGARAPRAAAAPAAATMASAAAATSGAPAQAQAQSSYGDVSLGKPTTDVGVLRRRLLEKIVDRRLFRESELRPFLVAIGLGNKHIDGEVLKEAIRAVETEFYL